MKKNKGLMIGVILMIVATLSIAFAAHFTRKNAETHTEASETTVSTETVTVPPVQTTETEQGAETETSVKLDLNVSEMTRNPKPEIVDVEITYGTMEAANSEEK